MIMRADSQLSGLQYAETVLETAQARYPIPLLATPGMGRRFTARSVVPSVTLNR